MSRSTRTVRLVQSYGTRSPSLRRATRRDETSVTSTSRRQVRERVLWYAGTPHVKSREPQAADCGIQSSHEQQSSRPGGGNWPDEGGPATSGSLRMLQVPSLVVPGVSHLHHFQVPTSGCGDSRLFQTAASICPHSAATQRRQPCSSRTEYSRDTEVRGDRGAPLLSGMSSSIISSCAGQQRR